MKQKPPNNYFYIKAKAERLLKDTPDTYRVDDYFHYPLIEWDIDYILFGSQQISSDSKGITKSKCIIMPNLKTANQLMMTFHFKTQNKLKIENAKKDNIYLLRLMHLTQKEKRIELFFKIDKKCKIKNMNQLVKIEKSSLDKKSYPSGDGKSQKTAYFFKTARNHEEAIQFTYEYFKMKNIEHLNNVSQKIGNVNSKFIYDIHRTNKGTIWIKIPKPNIKL